MTTTAKLNLTFILHLLIQLAIMWAFHDGWAALNLLAACLASGYVGYMRGQYYTGE